MSPTRHNSEVPTVGSTDPQESSKECIEVAMKVRKVESQRNRRDVQIILNVHIFSSTLGCILTELVRDGHTISVSLLLANTWWKGFLSRKWQCQKDVIDSLDCEQPCGFSCRRFTSLVTLPQTSKFALAQLIFMSLLNLAIGFRHTGA